MTRDIDSSVAPDLVEGAAGAPGDDSGLRKALETVFYDWWGDYHHALSAGAPGDVVDLLSRLNAVSAKRLISSSEAPSARENATVVSVTMYT